MRLLLLSIWAHRAALSNHHPDCAQTRLLFPLALCFAFTSSSITRDAIPSHRAAFGNYWLDSSAISFGRRRKKLEAPADCGCYSADDRDHPRHIYSAPPVSSPASPYED